MPGGDVNPYLAVAGMVAAGLDGIETRPRPSRRPSGNAYVGDSARVPHTMAEALRPVGGVRVDPRDLRRGGPGRTTRTWPASSWRPSPAPSRTGSDTAVSSGFNGDRSPTPRRARAPTRPGAAMHDVINPATEQVVATVPSASRTETDAAIARAHAACPAWRARRAGRPGQPAAALLGHRARAQRGARPTRGRQRRATPSATPAGRRTTSRTCSATTPGAPERLFGRQIPVAGRHRHHVQGAGGRRRRHRAVELPDAHRRLGLRPGARRRLHRRPQARRAHAAHGDPPRRARPRGGPPRGRLHRRARARARSSASASSTTPWCARSSSPAAPRSASGSWPAAPRR